MDSASAFIRAVITKAKLTWMKLMQCNSQRSLKLSRLSFVLAFWGTGSHHGKPAEIPWVAFDGFRQSAAAHSCFSEMGIEMTAKDVLIALFDSENHHPFSDPASAADLALKRLSDAGYAVVPVEPSDAMIEAGRLGDPLPCDVGAIWRFMVNAGQG